MALPVSPNPISFNNVNQELGRQSPYNQTVALNDGVVRTLFQRTTAGSSVAMSDGWGKSNFSAQPSAVTVSYIGAYNAQVSWSNGSNNYRTRIYSTSSGGTALYDSTSNVLGSTLANLQNLTAATTYTLYVCYVNSSGAEGPRTASSSITTKTVKNLISGANSVVYFGTKAYYKFTSSGNMTVTQKDNANLSFQYTLVGGGANGNSGSNKEPYQYECGGDGGSGGQAGGVYYYSTNLANTNLNQAYAVTIAAAGYGNHTTYRSDTSAFYSGPGGGTGGTAGCGGYGGQGGNGSDGDYSPLQSIDSNVYNAGLIATTAVYGGGGGGGGGGYQTPGGTSPGGYGAGSNYGSGAGGNGGSGSPSSTYNYNGYDGSNATVNTGAGGGGGGGAGGAPDNNAFYGYGGSGGSGASGVAWFVITYCE